MIKGSTIAKSGLPKPQQVLDLAAGRMVLLCNKRGIAYLNIPRRIFLTPCKPPLRHISRLGQEDDKALFQLFSPAKVGQKQQSRTSGFCKLRIFTID